MSTITIYSTQWCSFGLRAEQLLQRKGIADVRKLDVGSDPAMRQEMINRSGQRTVPPIFIGDTHVGGFDDLAALDRTGCDTYQDGERRRVDGQMQGARSAATETYPIDRLGSEHRATPQVAHRSGFSTACYTTHGARMARSSGVISPDHWIAQRCQARVDGKSQ